MAKKKKNKSALPDGSHIIAVNKKAKFDYHIDEAFEAGIVLTGNEIKSIRNGNINLKESYIRPRNGELFICGAHIREYEFSSAKEYDPVRPRKLLMHKVEIERLTGRVEAKGFTLVPLKIYLKKGRAKLEIALARGKDAPDKRRTIMDREKKVEAQRAMKSSFE